MVLIFVLILLCYIANIIDWNTMKLSNAIISLIHIWSYSAVGGVCNEDDHHPENGGYFIEGIAGFGDGLDPMSTSNRTITNSTWVPSGEYADGSLKFCTGRFCSQECRDNGCPDLISGHTCSNIRFCYAANSTSDVWIMPDEKALSTCDFTEATQICSPQDGSDSDCCNFPVEEDADLKVYLFASQNGCAAGQRAAVQVDDFADVGDACYGMGLTTSRIKSCTCNFEGSQSTLSEPCHSQFVAGCNHHFPDLGNDTSCCATESCVGHHLDFEHPIGKAKEENRKKLCLNDIPGRCLNTFDKTDDCCNTQCSECGTDADPFLEWAACTSGNATTGNATCGYGGHGGRFSPFECDFTKCVEGHKWHQGGDSYLDWIKTVDPDGFSISDATPTMSPVAQPTSSVVDKPSGTVMEPNGSVASGRLGGVYSVMSSVMSALMIVIAV